MGPTRILLVRHGQSEGNASGVIQGRLDFGLTQLGLAQARATAASLLVEPVAAVVSSPLERAAATARLIAAAHGLEPELDPALAEYDIGEISGLTGPQIRERFPEIVAAYRKGTHPRFPGEEGRRAFHDRVAAALQRLHGRGTVVAVAHGGVVSAICYQVLGLDPVRRGLFETANCSITEVAPDRTGRLVLARQNDTCHLRDIETSLDAG